MNCLLKHVIEGKMTGTGRRTRRKQLLDDITEMRRYWKVKEETLDRTVWRTRFGRGYGPDIKTDYVIMIIIMIMIVLH
jgi:hypothetical protein